MCVFCLYWMHFSSSSHTSVHPLNFLCPNYNGSHGKCWLVFYFLAASSGHLVRRVVWRLGAWGGGQPSATHTLLKTYECIITLTKTICSTTLSEDSSWCASEPLGLGSSGRSVRYQLSARSPSSPFSSHFSICKINLDCRVKSITTVISSTYTTALNWSLFCPYAFQIVINSQLYIHCLLWQPQSGNEWSGSLILRRCGSARTLGGSC